MTSMDSFQRKANLSFAQSDNNSPKKVVSPSPNSTAGGTKKGGFLSGLFSGKKKNLGDSNAFSPAKNMESPTKLLENNQNTKKPKSKLVNRKNIADGRIRLNIVDNDRVPEDYQIEYKDNPFEILDHNPNRTTSYIENLRSRDFSMINNREVKRFIESQQQKKDIAPPLAVQNLELDLIEMQGSYYKFFGKLYRFFQGLLPGFCILHLFLIFGGPSTSTSAILASYVLNCLRLYQIMYLIAVISALGAAHRYVETKLKYQEAVHSQPFLKDSLNSQVTKYLIATICFVIVYVIVVFNREFVSILSNEAYSIDAVALAQRFQAFQILSAITAGFSLAGWLSLILAFEEVSSVQQDMVNYQNDLTGDESMEETP